MLWVAKTVASDIITLTITPPNVRSNVFISRAIGSVTANLTAAGSVTPGPYLIFTNIWCSLNGAVDAAVTVEVSGGYTGASNSAGTRAEFDAYEIHDHYLVGARGAAVVVTFNYVASGAWTDGDNGCLMVWGGFSGDGSNPR